MALDRAGYLALLMERVAATSRPVLSDATVAAILDSHPTPDTAGRLADDDDWVPTYDLDAAAAEGWRVKGGKVAGDFNFAADGATYSKADVMAHCLAMEAKYASRSHGISKVGAMGSTAWADRYSEWDGTTIP